MVGRLLLPVRVMTGGSTAAGGTWAAAETAAVSRGFAQHARPARRGATGRNYLSELGEEAVYFLLLSAVQGLNLTHVPGGVRRKC